VTTRTLARAPSREALLWAATACALGFVIGAVATVNGVIALGVAVALALALALLRSAASLLFVLTASVFVDALDVAGVPLSRLLAPLALLVVAVAIAIEARPRLAPAPLAWAAAYSGWALVSILWTIDGSQTRFALLSLAIALVYMLAFATLIDSQQQLGRVLHAFVLTAVVVGTVGIVGFVLKVPGLLQAGRAVGGSGDPNFFGMYEVMAIPVALMLAAEARSARVRKALYAGIAVLILAVFASVSRGDLVTLVVIGVVMLVAPARALFRSRRQKAGMFATLGTGALVAVVLSAGAVTARVESVGSTDVTGSGRTALWRAAWTSIGERPLLGLGFGGFPAAVNDLMRRTPGIDFRHIELHPGRGSEAHDVYVSAIAELGVPGLALLLGLVLATARELRRAATTARRVGADVLERAANALLLSLLAWSIASLFLTTQTSRALWIVIGISLVMPALVDSRARARDA
jgi:O-antigen ligase